MNREEYNEIVVCSLTSYKRSNSLETSRAALATRTFEKIKAIGIRIIVIDDNSEKEFIDAFEKTGAEVVQQKGTTYGSGRRQAIRAGYSTCKPVIVLMEPEKYTFVPHILETARLILSGNADIVIPKRKSLSSYPYAQRHIEKYGNAVWKLVTGTNLDAWFGPHIIGRGSSHIYTNYDGKYGDLWDSTVVPLIDAIRSGKRCTSLKINYSHPVEQKEDESFSLEFTLKRLNQLNNLVNAITSRWSEHENRN